MPLWLIVFLKHYGLFLLSIALLYAFGRFLLFTVSSFLKIKGFYQHIFFSLALGTFAVVIASSVTITQFKTISSGFFLCGFFLIYELFRYKSEKNENFALKYFEESNKSNRKIFLKISVLVILSLLFYSWQAVMILKGGNFPFAVPERDYVYYADLSELIWQTGQENIYASGNLVNEKYFGMSPYHYFELWFGAFFSRIYGIENLISQQLLVFPFFFFLMAISLLSVVEAFAIPDIKNISVAFMLLFIGGIPFIPDYSSDYCKWLTIAESPIIYEKSAHHYWIAVIGFLFILNHFFTAGFIIFLSLIFVSVSTLPGIACGALLFLLLSYIFRWQRKTDLLRQSAYFASTIIFFFSVYALFGNTKFNLMTHFPVLYYTDLSPLLENVQSIFFTVKVALIELAVRIYKIPFLMVLYLLPYIVIIIVLAKGKTEQLKTMKLSLIFISLSLLSAIFCYGFFYKMYDSGQFYDNLFFFIFSFISISVIIFLNNEQAKTRNIFTGLIAFIFIFKIAIYTCNRKNQIHFFKEIYSDEYLKEISETNSGKHNMMGICFNTLPGEERITGRNALIGNRIVGYTGLFPQYSTTIDLSLIEMENWDAGRWGEIEKIIVQTSPFYQFVEEQKFSGKFLNIEHSRIDFINEFNIKYAIVSKNAMVSSLIEERTEKVITDSKSGERFMLLK